LSVKISILVPAFNHGQFIKDLLDSLQNLHHKEYEVIVVDDGSNDRTLEILSELLPKYTFSWRLYTQENHGVAYTINYLVSLAKYDWISLVASDDVLLPERFDRQVQMILQNPRLVACYGDGLAWNGRVTSGLVHSRELSELLASNDVARVLRHITTRVPAFFVQGLLLKRNVYNSIGGLDFEMVADDWILNIKIFNNIKETAAEYWYDTSPVFLYRLHPTNAHKNFKRQMTLIDQVVHRYIPENHRYLFAKWYLRFAIDSLVNQYTKGIQIVVRYFTTTAIGSAFQAVFRQKKAK